MAIEKETPVDSEYKDKLETYQKLKEEYLCQKKELSEKGLEQKSLTDPDSRRMKNNGSLDICYNVQSVVDSQNHFVVDISTTNDINDQNQLHVMAKNAKKLLDIEECTVIADTGYYNATEIKNCIDDGMTVYIKKSNPIIVQRTMNFVKKNSPITRKMIHTLAQQVNDYYFLKTRQRMD